MNLVINPNAKSASNKIASPTRRLSDVTARLVFPRSFTRKNNPLPRHRTMASITTIIRKLSIEFLALIRSANRIKGRR